MELAALESILDDYGIDRVLFPPTLVASAVQGFAFAMTYDQTAGFETAQQEASSQMDRLIDHLEQRRASRLALDGGSATS